MFSTPWLNRLGQLLLVAVGLVCPHAEPLPLTHLKVVGSWDFVSQYKNYEAPFWLKTVPEGSGGQITAEITPFNQLGLRGSEITRLMQLGMIDFGSTVLAYGADDEAEVEGVDLPGLNQTVEDAHKVVDAYLPLLDQYFQKKHGVKILAIWPYPAQVLYCKAPLKHLTDLKGRIVRVGTRPIAELIEALGGISINIPFGESYQQIKQGHIDCAATGTLPGNAAHLYEVTHYLYPLPIGWSMAMQGVNLKTWSRLDPAVQAYLSNGIGNMTQGLWAAAADETSDGINCNTGQGKCVEGTTGNMTLVPVADEDRVRLRRIFQDVIVRRWAQRCDASCLADWNRSVGKISGVVAKP